MKLHARKEAAKADPRTILAREVCDRFLTAAEKSVKDKPFREFVFALYETGCRPSEVARVTAENFDSARSLRVFEQHKTRKKTGKPRVVYLTPAMVELTKALVAKYPAAEAVRRKAGTRSRPSTGGAPPPASRST